MPSKFYGQRLRILKHLKLNPHKRPATRFQAPSKRSQPTQEARTESTANLVRSSRVNLFALLIGINEYSKRPLAHAVSDADEVERLLSDLGVPRKNITSLRNEEATGKGIRGALQLILDNNDLNADDTVIIYFAGHGSTTNAPDGWPTRNGKMQMLLPYDFDVNLSDDVEGDWTQPGRGILDVELGDTIKRISVKKGGVHFIVILDCCYSGSGTRSGDTVRCFDLPHGYTIPANALPPRPLRESFDYYQDCILLAACGEDQEAFENSSIRHGRFTYALLRIFRNENLEQLTYSDLIDRMAAQQYEFNGKQTPRIEGFNLDWFVFTQTVRRAPPIIYNIMVEGDGFCLEGGIKNLIADGARFTVHTDQSCTPESLVATVVARKVETTVTHCSLLSTESQLLPDDSPLSAIQSHHGRLLRLSIDQKDPHYNRWKTIIDDNFHDINIRSICLVESDQEADLAITTDGDTVVFEVKNEMCRHYDLTHLSWKSVRIDDSEEYLIKILCGAANFFRILDLSNIQDQVCPEIDVQCLQVCRGRFRETWIPKPDAPNLNANNKIYINFEEKSVRYGYEIKNHSSQPFYVAVFMFDVYDLKISRYDLPVEQVTSPSYPSTPSLPANQSLRIGFGDSGVLPRMYGCPEGRATDLSFLKVFLSSKPHKFSGIAQDSPFKMGVSRGDIDFYEEDVEIFDTHTIPVIQGPPAWLRDHGYSSG